LEVPTDNYHTRHSARSIAGQLVPALYGLALALYRLDDLVLLVLIFAHFKIVYYFRQQFKYRSSFGFARRGIAQSAVERDVLVQQEPVHLLLPNFLDWQTTRLKSYPNRSTIRRYKVKDFRRYPEAFSYTPSGTAIMAQEVPIVRA